MMFAVCCSLFAVCSGNGAIDRISLISIDYVPRETIRKALPHGRLTEQELVFIEQTAGSDLPLLFDIAKYRHRSAEGTTKELTTEQAQNRMNIRR